MTNDEFEQVYYPKYHTVIRAIARKLAQTNDTLAEDLYQEGLIALWNCDPKKARDNPDAFIRQAVKFRMIDCLRREKLASTESLDARFERLEQLMMDDSGALYLLNQQDRWTRWALDPEGLPEDQGEV